jgi:hypothetical protein
MMPVRPQNGTKQPKFTNPIPTGFKSAFHPGDSDPSVSVFETLYVVLAQVIPKLNFNDLERCNPRVPKPVLHPDRHY